MSRTELKNETTEMWREHKEAGQKKRRDNKKASTQVLIDKHIDFESKNFGVHIIVSNKNGFIDYWPSTGKFIQRFNNKSGRGINNLLKLKLNMLQEPTLKPIIDKDDGSCPF